MGHSTQKIHEPCILCGREAKGSDIAIYQKDPEFPDVLEDMKRLGCVCGSCGEHVKRISQNIDTTPVIG